MTVVRKCIGYGIKAVQSLAVKSNPYDSGFGHPHAFRVGPPQGIWVVGVVIVEFHGATIIADNGAIGLVRKPHESLFVLNDCIYFSEGIPV